MKTVTVTCQNLTDTVELLHCGLTEQTPLSPELARRAARCAFGHSQGVTVGDGRTTYRLTKSGARKIKDEE